MGDEETRIREYEEKLQLESLKRKVSMMKFPAPEKKKSKLSFSKSLSSLGNHNLKSEPRELPAQVKLKTSAKTIKLPTIVTEVTKSRIVEKPWKFATKNVDECQICSNHLFSVCHPHISTAIERRKSVEEESYFCNICAATHSLKEKGRRRIVLGASTLHNVWKENTYTPGYHVDFDCIIGGEIHDVHESFLNQYSEEKEAMDIILACGVNNVPTVETAQTIIFQLRSLIKSIEEQNRDNRAVVATLVYAPKYCDVGVPPSRNMLEKVREVNRWILEYNKEATGVQFDLGKHGVEGDPGEGEVKHLYGDWREPSIDRKLHFAAAIKQKIATQIITVFEDLDKEGIIC